MHTAPAEPASRHGALPEAPGRVLVVEDEHLVAMHLVKSLRELDFEVLGPAPNGRKAIESAAEDKPDLAIVDIRMPDTNGIAVAEELFSKYRVPVIILSAFSDPRFVEQASLTGVFGYLLKPAMMDDLRVNIAVAWSRYREQMRLLNEVDELKRRLGQAD